jgi:S-adenosylmethionine decarboxylase
MTGSTTTFGDHYLVDLHGCDAELIAAVQPTEEALLLAATRCGSTIIEHHFHQFSPQGVSGIILIAESHISVHTWPENGFVAVDIFTSGNRMKPEIAIDILQETFQAERVDVVCMARGKLAQDSGWRQAQ